METQTWPGGWHRRNTDIETRQGMCNTGEAKKLNPRSKNHSNKTETNNINNQKTITESLHSGSWQTLDRSFQYGTVLYKVLNTLRKQLHHYVTELQLCEGGGSRSVLLLPTVFEHLLYQRTMLYFAYMLNNQSNKLMSRVGFCSLCCWDEMCAPLFMRRSRSSLESHSSNTLVCLSQQPRTNLFFLNNKTWIRS